MGNLLRRERKESFFLIQFDRLAYKEDKLGWTNRSAAASSDSEDAELEPSMTDTIKKTLAGLEIIQTYDPCRIYQAAKEC